MKLDARSCQPVSAFLLTAAISGICRAQGDKGDVLDLVDPLIGTTNAGHVFPGASLPFGMAKAVADTDGDNLGGFDSAAEYVRGLSHMHDSGTGGSASLGNFPIFPQAGCSDDDISNCKFSANDRQTNWVNDSVKARPGSFSISLDSSIRADMTVSNHSALYRFTFPDQDQLSPVILLDMIDLPGSRQRGSASVDADTGRITATGTFKPSFGIGTYDLHVCAEFSGADVRDVGVFQNDTPDPSAASIEVQSNDDPKVSAGAYTRLNAPENNVVLARVGVSFMSVDQACGNAEHELRDFNFGGTVSAAEDAWRRKLNVVEIDTTGVSRDMQVIFWSGIYRAMLSPQDYTGENPLWESDEPYYDSFYCIWDSYRIVHPLITVLDPQSQARMIRTLIDVYRHEGYLPDCRMSLCKGWTQGGSNADVLLVDSFVKGLTDGIDWDTGYEALIKDAEDEPPDWKFEGRGQIAEYQSLGYVPMAPSYSRSISRTIEYAYNDFCIAEMAKNTGRHDDYEKYAARSRNWRNMYRRDQKSEVNGKDTGFEGFFQPRYANGSWGHQDPLACSALLDFNGCYLGPNGLETYEGSSWLYSFYAPHDMAELVDAMGGAEEFASRLQYFHNSGIVYMGNEPNLLPVFQYHYAGRPDLSTRQIHAYIPGLFHTGTDGIPGNDDSGAMGSFIAFSMMGLYPVAGQDVYLISPPFFAEVSVRNPQSGNTAVVRNIGFDPGYENVYVKRVTRDGEEWTKNWIGHDFFVQGGILEVELGLEDERADWGTKEADLPPSMEPGD